MRATLSGPSFNWGATRPPRSISSHKWARPAARMTARPRPAATEVLVIFTREAGGSAGGRVQQLADGLEQHPGWEGLAQHKVGTRLPGGEQLGVVAAQPLARA